MNIKLKVDGVEVPVEQMGDALGKAVMREMMAQIRATVESVHCSIHGEHARAEFTGTSGKQLKYDIHGCCDALVEQAKQSLGVREL